MLSGVRILGIRIRLRPLCLIYGGFSGSFVLLTCLGSGSNGSNSARSRALIGRTAGRLLSFS